MPFVVLMPIFASQVLHGGPHTLGYLMGASGVGALSRRLARWSAKNVRGLVSDDSDIGRRLRRRPHPLRALSQCRPVALPRCSGRGFGMMQGMAASNTILQTLVPEESAAA